MNISMRPLMTTPQPQFGNIDVARKQALRDRLWTFVETQLPESEKIIAKLNTEGWYESHAVSVQAAKTVFDTASRLVANDFELNMLA